MKIYLTRHGETIWNTQGRMQGWCNSDLTAKGISNAQKLGVALKDVKFDIVYCSSSGRALQTADFIIGNRSIPIIKTDNLREMGLGIWEGMPHNEIEILHPKEKYAFWNEPHNYVPINGETFQDLINRVNLSLQEILNTPNLENVLVVTHAIVVKAFYFIIKNYDLKDFWKEPFIYDTCLSIIEFENNKLKFILEADLSHL